MTEGVWEEARSALAEPDPWIKCERVQALWASVKDWPERLQAADKPSWSTDELPCGQPEAPQLIPPHELPRRGLGTVEGRVALIHAIAHIEFNAINLGLDAACRFDQMPDGAQPNDPGHFYWDWLSVAADEARHFLMLSGRLSQLGAKYGDLAAHDGLWAMAIKTEHDVLIRMALVPRVLEARGLDVTPGMIDKLNQAKDHDTVGLLEIILEEEEAHVTIGTRWFRYCCGLRGLEPDSTFDELLNSYFKPPPKGPYNEPARRRAGFSEAELERLKKNG
jgi:uncharacterized ferritin-like protein (DUF455 family)